MERLIDAEHLIKEIRETYEYNYPTASGDFDTFATKLVPNIIKGVPTIDPVKHGHWKKLKQAVGIDLRECSVCGNYDNKLTAIHGHYCWNCGSKMDQEEE